MNRSLLVLLAVFAGVKVISASLVELGNDEVYYLLYARYPDWSHIDHPPMVGWMIQLFTLNLHLTSDLALRAGPIILGTATLYMLYAITRSFLNQKAAWYAAAFGVSSVYVGIIGGMFIMPDAPQLFFWSIALFSFLKAQKSLQYKWFIVAGIALASALASKYHSIFLISGILGYSIFHRRSLFASRAYWLMLAIAALGIVPVLIWNIKNDFISFSFQSSRVTPDSWWPNGETFGMEILGQFLYQNPVVFVLTFLTIIWLARRYKSLSNEMKFLLWVALPLYIVFTAFALYRRTLPHWTGPAFLTMLPLVAVWATFQGKRFAKLAFIGASSLAAIVFILGSLQIRFGIFTLDPKHRAAHNYMKDDATLDMWGWRLLSDELRSKLHDRKNIVFFSHGWFPTSHIDHYLAKPFGAQTVALGKPNKINKFYWTNREADLSNKQTLVYLTDSRNFKHPDDVFTGMVKYATPDTLWLTRGGKLAKTVFIFRINELDIQQIPKVHSGLE